MLVNTIEANLKYYQDKKRQTIVSDSGSNEVEKN